MGKKKEQAYDYENLKKLICADALVPMVDVSNDTSDVRLYEPASTKADDLKMVQLKSVPNCTVVLRLDKFFTVCLSCKSVTEGNEKKKQFKFEKFCFEDIDKLGVRHRCDFLLVTEYKGKRVLIFIELKTSLQGQTEQITTQFKGGTCLAKYISELHYQFYQDDSIVKISELRYVVFHIRGGLDKGKKKVTNWANRRGRQYDLPEAPLRYQVQQSGVSIPFGTLYGQLNYGG